MLQAQTRSQLALAYQVTLSLTKPRIVLQHRHRKEHLLARHHTTIHSTKMQRFYPMVLLAAAGSAIPLSPRQDEAWKVTGFSAYVAPHSITQMYVGTASTPLRIHLFADICSSQYYFRCRAAGKFSPVGLQCSDRCCDQQQPFSATHC